MEPNAQQSPQSHPRQPGSQRHDARGYSYRAQTMPEEEADITGRCQAIVAPMHADQAEQRASVQAAVTAHESFQEELEQFFLDNPHRGQRLLVVDDEETNLAAMIKYLKRMGFDVDVATNASTAIVCARATPYDGAVIDVVLPGTQGPELVRQIRTRSKRKAMPIILISGYAKNLSELSDGCGADDFLAKPFYPQALFAKLEKYLSIDEDRASQNPVSQNPVSPNPVSP